MYFDYVSMNINGVGIMYGFRDGIHRVRATQDRRVG